MKIKLYLPWICFLPLLFACLVLVNSYYRFVDGVNALVILVSIAVMISVFVVCLLRGSGASGAIIALIGIALFFLSGIALTFDPHACLGLESRAACAIRQEHPLPWQGR